MGCLDVFWTPRFKIGRPILYLSFTLNCIVHVGKQVGRPTFYVSSKFWTPHNQLLTKTLKMRYKDMSCEFFFFSFFLIDAKKSAPCIFLWLSGLGACGSVKQHLCTCSRIQSKVLCCLFFCVCITCRYCNPIYVKSTCARLAACCGLDDIWTHCIVHATIFCPIDVLTS